MIFCKIWIPNSKRKSKKRIEIVSFGGFGHVQLVGLARDIILHYKNQNRMGLSPNSAIRSPQHRVLGPAKLLKITRLTNNNVFCSIKTHQNLRFQRLLSS